MVDLVDIGFSIDSSQIKTAKQELAELGNSFNSATKSASIFEQAFARAAAQSARDAKFLRDTVRANQELINSNLGVTNSYKSAKDSASAFGLILSNIDKASKAFTANFNNVVGVTGGRATSGGAGFGALADEIDRLGQKYNSIYASSKLYENTLNELNRAVMLGVISDKQREASIEALNAQMATGTGIFKNYTQQLGNNANRMGTIFQQTGYQVSDFIVQVQSGTNPLVAFSQQATQLVGSLYALPPAFLATEVSIVGLEVTVSTLIAGFTIIVPLLAAVAMAFMRSGDSAKSASQKTDVYSEAIKNLTSEIQKNQDAFLKAKFDTDILGVASASQQIEDFQKRITSLQASIERMKSQGGKAAAFSGLVGGTLEELEAQKAALQSLLDKISAQAEAQRMLNGGLSVAGGLHQAAIMARQEELRLAKEQAIAEQLAADKSILLKNYFHALAGEGAAVSVSLNGWAGSILSAVDAAAQLQTVTSRLSANANMKGRGLPSDYFGMTTAPVDTGTLFKGITFGPTGAAITPDKTKKGGAEKKDPLVELQKQIALQEELSGKTEAEQKVRQALGDSWASYSPIVIKGLEDQIQKQMDLEERLKEQQQIFDTVKTSMEDAFMGMVDGTKSAKDAFKQMAAAIIKELYNVLVVQRMVGSFNASTGVGTGLSGIIGGALGGLFGGGSGYVKGMAGRANGGPIDAGVPYMVGERGPEMIIPKSSGTVLTTGQTNSVLGGSNESYVVHNNINVTGSDSVMVRQEIAKMIPQISSATKAAMIDAKRRGGQMGAAFR